MMVNVGWKIVTQTHLNLICELSAAGKHNIKHIPCSTLYTLTFSI